MAEDVEGAERLRPLGRTNPPPSSPLRSARSRWSLAKNLYGASKVESWSKGCDWIIASVALGRHSRLTLHHLDPRRSRSPLHHASNVRIGTQGWNYDAWGVHSIPRLADRDFFPCTRARSHRRSRLDFYAIPSEKVIQAGPSERPMISCSR